MENQLIKQLQAVMVMPADMEIPAPIVQLYEWIETNRLYVDTKGGRGGFLYPEQALKESWADQGRAGQLSSLPLRVARTFTTGLRKTMIRSKSRPV